MSITGHHNGVWCFSSLQQASKGPPDDVLAPEIRYRSVGVGTFRLSMIYLSRQTLAAQIVSRYVEAMGGVRH